jgi:hypothetical protein
MIEKCEGCILKDRRQPCCESVHAMKARLSELLDPDHPDHNPRYWDAVLRMSAASVGRDWTPPDAPPPSALRWTAKEAANIEACDFRSSACGCLTREASCLQAGYPVMAYCLTAGPGGKPCAGTFQDYGEA